MVVWNVLDTSYGNFLGIYGYHRHSTVKEVLRLVVDILKLAVPVRMLRPLFGFHIGLQASS